MPLCFGASGSVRARQTPHCAFCAADVQTFWPVSFQPPSTRTAFVRSAARSDPAPGSLNSWHQIKSPRNVGGTNCSTCSGLPCSRIVGAAHQPITRSGRTTPAAASSWSISSCSAGPAARPYGRGQCGASRPVSASATCRFSAGAATTSATAEAISGRRSLDRLQIDAAGPVGHPAGSARRPDAASRVFRRGTARCRTRGADTGGRHAPR